MSLFVSLSGKRDLEASLALGVEPGGQGVEFVTAVEVATAALVLLAVAVDPPKRRVVRAGLHDELHLGITHGLTEVVAGVDGHVDGLPCRASFTAGVTLTSNSGLRYSCTSNDPLALCSPERTSTV